MQGKQLAVFDLEKGVEIPLAKMEGGVYTPIDEATNVFDKYRRETPPTDTERGLGGISEVSKGGSASKGADEITESLFDTQRTYLGKVLDNWGFSTRGVIEGTNEFLFRQSWTQNAMQTIADKFGAVINIKTPIVVHTTKGAKNAVQKLAIPVEK